MVEEEPCKFSSWAHKLCTCVHGVVLAMACTRDWLRFAGSIGAVLNVVRFCLVFIHILWSCWGCSTNHFKFSYDERGHWGSERSVDLSWYCMDATACIWYSWKGQYLSLNMELFAAQWIGPVEIPSVVWKSRGINHKCCWCILADVRVPPGRAASIRSDLLLRLGNYQTWSKISKASIFQAFQHHFASSAASGFWSSSVRQVSNWVCHVSNFSRYFAFSFLWEGGSRGGGKLK